MITTTTPNLTPDRGLSRHLIEAVPHIDTFTVPLMFWAELTTLCSLLHSWYVVISTTGHDTTCQDILNADSTEASL